MAKKQFTEVQVPKGGSVGQQNQPEPVIIVWDEPTSGALSPGPLPGQTDAPPGPGKPNVKGK